MDDGLSDSDDAEDLSNESDGAMPSCSPVLSRGKAHCCPRPHRPNLVETIAILKCNKFGSPFCIGYVARVSTWENKPR